MEYAVVASSLVTLRWAAPSRRRDVLVVWGIENAARKGGRSLPRQSFRHNGLALYRCVRVAVYPELEHEDWPAAGFVDTEIGCFMKPEVG